MMLALRGLPVSSESSPHHEPAVRERTLRRSPALSAIHTSHVPLLIR